MKEKIIEIIIETVKEYNEGLSKENQISQDLDASIYGDTNGIDSLGLVSFIINLEQNIEERLNKVVSLADEKAMSQKKSPYESINILSEYILQLID